MSLDALLRQITQKVLKQDEELFFSILRLAKYQEIYTFIQLARQNFSAHDFKQLIYKRDSTKNTILHYAAQFQDIETLLFIITLLGDRTAEYSLLTDDTSELPINLLEKNTDSQHKRTILENLMSSQLVGQKILPFHVYPSLHEIETRYQSQRFGVPRPTIG